MEVVADFIEGIEIWLEEHGPRFIGTEQMERAMSYMDIIDGITDAIANVGEVGVSVLDNLFEVASGVLGPVFVAGD